MNIDSYMQLADEAFGEPTIVSDIEESVTLKSPLKNVADQKWTEFVRGSISSSVNSVSGSNALGMFELTPRRMADFGFIKKLKRTKSKSNRTIWTGVFVPPLTCEKFLKSPRAQYRVFESSMVDYARKISDGEIKKNPEMSMAGALAILHRAGPKGLQTWDSSERFPMTSAAYERLKDLF